MSGKSQQNLDEQIKELSRQLEHLKSQISTPLLDNSRNWHPIDYTFATAGVADIHTETASQSDHEYRDKTKMTLTELGGSVESDDESVDALLDKVREVCGLEYDDEEGMSHFLKVIDEVISSTTIRLEANSDYGESRHEKSRETIRDVPETIEHALEKHRGSQHVHNDSSRDTIKDQHQFGLQIHCNRGLNDIVSQKSDAKYLIDSPRINLQVKEAIPNYRYATQKIQYETFVTETDSQIEVI
jgi:hypothetical protein